MLNHTKNDNRFESGAKVKLTIYRTTDYDVMLVALASMQNLLATSPIVYGDALELDIKIKVTDIMSESDDAGFHNIICNGVVI